MTLGPADEEDAAFSSFSADDLEKWECKERVRLEDGPCLGGEGSSSVEEDPPGSVIPGVRESRCRDRCRGIENEDSSTKGLMLGSEEARGAGVCPLPSEPSNRTDLRLPTIIGMGLCASKLCRRGNALSPGSRKMEVTGCDRNVLSISWLSVASASPLSLSGEHVEDSEDHDRPSSPHPLTPRTHTSSRSPCPLSSSLSPSLSLALPLSLPPSSFSAP